MALCLRSNRLLLNNAKTEIFWCVMSGRQRRIPTRIGDDYIAAAASVRDRASVSTLTSP